MEIIDFHVHPMLDDRSYRGTEEMIRFASVHGVKRICLLGDVLYFGAEPTREQIKKVNDNTMALLRKWPQFFYGFCFLNPRHPEKFLRSEVDRCLSHENFKGIKLEIAVNTADRRVDKVMRIAGEKKLIVLQHAWNTEIVGNRKHQSDPEDVACVARRFPDVKIVMAHITSAGQRGVLAVSPCKNVWVDTSGGQPVSGTVEYAVEKLGAERILFGSDAPGRDFSAQLGKIRGANIHEKARKAILSYNAKRLLGIR